MASTSQLSPSKHSKSATPTNKTPSWTIQTVTDQPSGFTVTSPVLKECAANNGVSVSLVDTPSRKRLSSTPRLSPSKHFKSTSPSKLPSWTIKSIPVKSPSRPLENTEISRCSPKPVDVTPRKLISSWTVHAAENISTSDRGHNNFISGNFISPFYFHFFFLKWQSIFLFFNVLGQSVGSPADKAHARKVSCGSEATPSLTVNDTGTPNKLLSLHGTHSKTNNVQKQNINLGKSIDKDNSPSKTIGNTNSLSSKQISAKVQKQNISLEKSIDKNNSPSKTIANKNGLSSKQISAK
ncbi:uncharacterized protein LOC113214742, partial [Frankliniella occidentalis]|uniref:Uncharacterized protein LOC113214742 n=1 Tax=Frankliniella occidentalis TaxID=133901 RepID=A0A9C6XVM4_FRAOC